MLEKFAFEFAELLKSIFNTFLSTQILQHFGQTRPVHRLLQREKAILSLSLLTTILSIVLEEMLVSKMIEDTVIILILKNLTPLEGVQ